MEGSLLNTLSFQDTLDIQNGAWDEERCTRLVNSVLFPNEKAGLAKMDLSLEGIINGRYTALQAPSVAAFMRMVNKRLGFRYYHPEKVGVMFDWEVSAGGDGTGSFNGSAFLKNAINPNNLDQQQLGENTLVFQRSKETGKVRAVVKTIDGEIWSRGPIVDEAEAQRSRMGAIAACRDRCIRLAVGLGPEATQQELDEALLKALRE
jgi:hypothetical protein